MKEQKQNDLLKEIEEIRNQQKVAEDNRTAELKAIDIDSLDVSEVIGEIVSVWDSLNFNNDKIKKVFKGISLNGSCICLPNGETQKKLKVGNPYIGLGFNISKKIEPNNEWDVRPMLEREFRFSFEVCRLGKNISNKGLVLSVSEKRYTPNIQTLRKEGISLSLDEVNALDLTKIEDVKVLFTKK